MKIKETYIVIDKVVAVRLLDTRVIVFVVSQELPFTFIFSTEEKALEVYEALEYRLDSK